MNYTWPSTKHLFKNKNLFFIYKKIKKKNKLVFQCLFKDMEEAKMKTLQIS